MKTNKRKKIKYKHLKITFGVTKDKREEKNWENNLDREIIKWGLIFRLHPKKIKKKYLWIIYLNNQHANIHRSQFLINIKICFLSIRYKERIQQHISKNMRNKGDPQKWLQINRRQISLKLFVIRMKSDISSLYNYTIFVVKLIKFMEFHLTLFGIEKSSFLKKRFDDLNRNSHKKSHEKGSETNLPTVTSLIWV